MRPDKADHNNTQTLTDLPNVGANAAKKLQIIGIEHPKDLEGRDPYQIFDDLCITTGKSEDPRLLDIFISAIRFLDGESARPWWAFTAERKSRLNADIADVEQSKEPVKNGRIDYLEYPCLSIAQTEHFFSCVFAWRFTAYGEAYTVFEGAGIQGGFYLSQLVSHTANGSTLSVIYDDDLYATQARVVEFGGQICRDIFSFPGGHRFHFLDPNGNEWAVWNDCHCES